MRRWAVSNTFHREWVTPFQLLVFLGLRPGDSVSKISDPCWHRSGKEHVSCLWSMSVYEHGIYVKYLHSTGFGDFAQNSVSGCKTYLLCMCWSLHNYVKSGQPSWKRWIRGHMKVITAFCDLMQVRRAAVQLLIKNVLLIFCALLFHYSPIISISLTYSPLRTLLFSLY